MFRRSVSALLLFVLGLVIAGLLAQAGLRLSEAWSQRQTGALARVLAEADRTLFTALVGVRSQRGDAQSLLLAVDDARRPLEEMRQQAQERAAETIAALTAIPLPDAPRMKEDFLRRWEPAHRHYTLLFDEAAKPRAERDIRRIDPWYNAIGDLVDHLSAVSVAVSNNVRMADPELAELAQVRRLGWQIRDRYGLQCSLLRTNVNTAQPLDDRQRYTLGQYRGSAQAGWAGLDELLARSEVKPSVAAAVRAARQSYDAGMRGIDEALGRLNGAGKPLMPPSEWNGMCRTPFDPIVTIGLQALDSAIDRADAMVAEAERALTIDVMILIAALLTGVVAVRLVRQRFGAPVRQLLRCIARLAERDYATPVERLSHDDEFGQLAGALESLRQSAAEARRLAAEQEARRTAELERAGRMENLCHGFDSTADRALSALSEAAQSLRDTATRMRTLASDASAEAGTVAAAANEATGNVHTVAAATEQLTASISEISERVQFSATTAREAVEHARRTNATVEALSESAQRIGEVVKLISSIASQTNLLALNATIEAARAGEAGKGFAVVASEVKNLATQTGKATEEITQQVSAIQSTTGDAVEAIRGITRSIAGIDEMASAIAAAVQQQGAATQEIARNVQRAAEGTQQVTSTIGSVAGASQDTGRAAEEVLDRVERMVGDVGGLRRHVGDFLDKLRAV